MFMELDSGTGRFEETLRAVRFVVVEPVDASPEKGTLRARRLHDRPLRTHLRSEALQGSVKKFRIFRHAVSRVG
jgi:hypothetical protein